jgi:DNA (cytosine-5)-methyltransferase 1
MTTSLFEPEIATLKTVPKLRFMDFCAGIGGGRLGLEKAGMECVGFSEINSNAEKTYRLFFGETEKNYGDLMNVDPVDLPDFDLMIAGFPCQTFSVIGQRQGFQDHRGQVIYGLINILTAKNLKYFILENVKGLVNHDKGNTLKTILQDLIKAGYNVNFKVLNSQDYGTAQHRERVYIVGIRSDLNYKTFDFPIPQTTPTIENYLIDDSDKYLDVDDPTFLKYLANKYNNNQHTIENLLKNQLTVIDTRQSDLRIYHNRTPTLRTGRHGILYVKDNKFRKLSGYEALLLQGFPKELAQKTRNVIVENHLLAQAGNAMTVTTIQAIGQELLKSIT